jgi:hypothetical protein
MALWAPATGQGRIDRPRGLFGKALASFAKITQNQSFRAIFDIES